jgi:RNA polymerase sigma factor (sigma-70 family)
MNLSSENDLWNAFKAGDEQAFEEIYRLFYNPLFRYGRAVIHKEDLVEDAIQEMFLNLHRYRKTLKPLDAILPYLLASLKNTILKDLKFRSRFDTLTPTLDIETKIEISIEDAIILRELSENQIYIINEALKGLPPRQREAINLKFYQNLSNQQIAEVMGINYQSVINFLQKALQSLENSLIISPLSKRLYSLIFPFPIIFKNFSKKKGLK